MLPQIDGSCLSPVRVYSILVFHLLIHLNRGESQVVGPHQPIVALVDNDIILPCHVEPGKDVTAEILEWTRSDLTPRFVHVWRSGQDLVNTRNPSYRGRTSLFINELKNGNISLKLSRVKLSDEGTYQCEVPLMDKKKLLLNLWLSESSKLHNPQPEESLRHFQEQNQSSSANHSSMRGDIILEEIDRHGNYLCLKNNSSEDKLMAGWELKLQNNKNQPITYKFKENYTLRAGWALTLQRPGTRNPNTDTDDLMWINMPHWSHEEKLKISLISNTGKKHRLK